MTTPLAKTEKQCPVCDAIFLSRGEGKPRSKKFCSRICKNAYIRDVWRSGYNRSYERQRKAIDPVFKFKKDIHAAIITGMKRGARRGKLWDTLGYSGLDLRRHIEGLFTKDNGFRWENHGTVWEMDHIIPQSKFCFASLSDPGFKLCWSLNNLRPEVKRTNQLKRNRYSGFMDDSGQMQFLSDRVA